MRVLTTGLLILLLFSLIACSTENEGNDIGLDNTPPVIVVAGVVNNATVSGLVNIAATAADFFGIDAFVLRIDGVQVATGVGGSLTHAWNAAAATNGAHVLTFLATDTNANSTTTTINVTVTGGTGGDTTDPVITVSGVTDGANVNGSLNIHATATDNVGVTSFTLKRDGVVVANGVAGVIDYIWDTTQSTNAAHVLLFEASDAAANAAATQIDVTVNNAAGGASVAGTVFAQNGVDPIAGALIYVPQDGNSTGSENETDDGNAPNDPYHAFVYSAANGGFSLANVPLGAQMVIIIKGAFKKFINVNVLAGGITLSAADTTLPTTGGGGGAVPQIAVVTGDYDHIQNLLAKMGLGTLDGSGNLELGTEQFVLVDGNSSLPDQPSHPEFDVWVSDTVGLANYDIIFLNCGNNFNDWFAITPAAMTALKNWVEAGGRLYCSDWSSDYVEQLWPDRIDFFGGTDGLSTTPEGVGLARQGVSMASLDATVLDDNLRAWLDLPAINALNGDDTITISEWLPVWVAMDAIAASGVKNWVQGPAAAGGGAAVLRPLTVSFAAGSGLVLYSSYHTEETPAVAFTKNDRILEYLLIEVLY